MIAVLTESFAGKWPFWLSPRQVMVVPIGPVFNDYAVEVAQRLREAGFCAESDTDDSDTMNKKVRNAQLAQFNFIFGEFSFYLPCSTKLHSIFTPQLWARRSATTAL
jgi:threonyl-tRNA synthetase